MADPAPPSDSREHIGDDTGAPRWVKVFGIIAAVLVLLIIAVMFIGGGEHGPGRHTSSGGAGGQAPLATLTADLTPSGGDLGGRAPAEGGH